MKVLMILSLFLGFMGSSLLAQDDNSSLESRIQMLESQKGIESQKWDLNKIELDQKFAELKGSILADEQKKSREFWGAIIGIFLTVVGGYFVTYKRIQGQIESKLAKSSDEIQAHLSKEMEEKVRVRTDDMLTILIDDHKHLFLQMFEDFQRNRDYRFSKKILVLGPSEERIAETGRLLKGTLGFSKVDTAILTESPIDSGYDLTILDGGDVVEIRQSEYSDYENAIRKFVKNSPESDHIPLMYYGPRNSKLDLDHSKMYFANNKISLPARMMEAFQYADFVEQAKSNQS